MLAWLKALFARLFGRRTRPPSPEIGDDRPGPTPPPPVGMQQVIGVNGGTYPQPGEGPANFTLGMVESFAGTTPAYGAPRCQGETLPIIEYQALTSILGMSFGGDERDVGLPDLRGRVPIGGNPGGTFGQGTLTMTWLIATDSGGDAPVLGMIVPFGGNFAPAGWAICDGTLTPISTNVALFEVIGTAFGGNPQVYFALPNLINAAPIGAGGTIALGNEVPGPVAGLGLNWLICTSGAVAPAGGDGALPPTGQYVGQVLAFAGAQIPAGWSLCDGSLIATQANPELFQLIGYTYGGDRRSNFALPDLRGKMLPGT